MGREAYPVRGIDARNLRNPEVSTMASKKKMMPKGMKTSKSKSMKGGKSNPFSKGKKPGC